jgi:hypothetical protein
MNTDFSERSKVRRERGSISTFAVETSFCLRELCALCVQKPDSMNTRDID